MPEVVIRVRFTCGDRIDVVYADRDAATTETVVDRVVAVLSEDTGVLRCQHGDRLIVLFSRGIASIEVAPRGAVL
jgi:hypothetical protein